MKTVYLQQKKSGNYITAQHQDSNWTLIAECNTPSELVAAVKALPSLSTVIRASYSQSQLTSASNYYRIDEALRAFGMSVSKKNIELSSNK